jgi:hypothetical protein
MFNGRRQTSRGGTSRMMREYQVRFCERLGVKFPGPTRQKLLLPQCKNNGRFTSISGHKGRRSWMMRALRILDSPYAPTLGILRDFQDNLLPVSRVRRRGQAGCC